MQEKTPLVEALAKYERMVSHRLHVPAHDRGSILSMRTKSAIGQFAYAMDVTEVSGLDDLFDADGPLAEAQRLAAEAYGAAHTLFCTCGSSCALIAVVLATRAREVIVPRYCHVSLIHACILRGIMPRFVGADIDQESGLVLRMNTEQLAATIRDTAGNVPIVAVNPTYYGIATTIPSVAAGRTVVADEAHGAHFPFHPELPASLSQSGATVVVSGMHKTGGALTQTSLIRVHGSSPTVREIQSCLRLVHTTSPSYPLMASIDVARSWLATRGREVLGRTTAIGRTLEGMLGDRLGLDCPCRSLAAQSRIDGYDPLRLVFSAGRRDSGWLFRELRRSSGIQLEMEDGRNLVGVLGLTASEETVSALLAALDGLLPKAPIAEPVRREAAGMTSQAMAQTPELKLAPDMAFFSSSRAVSLDAAAGEVAAEIAAVHPPGVAIVIPGQRLTQDTIDLVACLKKAGSRFQGTADPNLSTIRVVGREGQ